MIMKMKGALKDGCTVNYTFNTTCTGMLFKSLKMLEGWSSMPSIFCTEKRDISPAPHLRKWKHHTQASKIDGKTCEWRTLFLFCSTIQRADSRACFIAVKLIQTWTSERYHPPTGYGKRNKLRESWLMQGHPGVRSLPMFGLCFTSSFISSSKGMTKQYKTKDLHYSSQPI